MTRSTSRPFIVARRGFTLVEMLIAVCMAVVIVAVTIDLLVRQGRFHRSLDETLTERSALRDGIDVLTTDLRTASVDDTVRFASDTAIEFFSTIGASTLCANPVGNRLVLPPDTLVSGNVLTAFTAQPDTGDYVVVYHDSSAMAPISGWQRFRIAALTTVAATTACPPSSGFTTPGDISAGGRSYEVTVVPSAVVAGRKGDPVRFIRQVRYDVYRASDAHWYLGFRRCGISGCASVQPVSGPYAADGDPPLTFSYYNAAGALLPTPRTTASITRIDVMVQGRTTVVPYRPGSSASPVDDSAIVSIAPRNTP